MHLCEIMPSKYIWTVILISVYGGEAGGKLMPFVAGLAMFGDSDDNLWRYFVIILSIPSILFVALAAVFIDESPTYFLSIGETGQASNILKKLISSRDIDEEDNLDKYIQSSTKSQNGQVSLTDLKSLLKNKYMVRSLVCVIVIGFSIKFTTYQLTYIITEVVFLNKQTETDYCSGTKEKTYFLQREDYIFLSLYMISEFIVKVLAMILARKISVDLKICGTVFLGVSICLAACLYTCPKFWITLTIYALIDASNSVVELYSIIYISEIVPSCVRSTVYGFMIFVMYIPVTVTPYLVQVLTKSSQHYLTTTTLSFTTISFIAGLLLPREAG